MLFDASTLHGGNASFATVDIRSVSSTALKTLHDEAPVYLGNQLRLPGADYLGCAKAASTPRMFSLILPNFKATLTGVKFRDDRVDTIS
jgi:hypothetical protein